MIISNKHVQSNKLKAAINQECLKLESVAFDKNARLHVALAKTKV